MFGKSDASGSADLEKSDERIDGFFEPEPEDLNAGIVVRNLRKVFKSLTGKLRQLL